MAKGTRPCLIPVGDSGPKGSPVDQIIDSGGRDLLDHDDPIAAETWASGIVEMFEPNALVPSSDPIVTDRIVSSAAPCI